MLTSFYKLIYSFCFLYLSFYNVLSSCIKAVAAHEKNMREQARKMNVATLRSQADDARNRSIEIKLAKVS